jgi:hypothetical protein
MITSIVLLNPHTTV